MSELAEKLNQVDLEAKPPAVANGTNSEDKIKTEKQLEKEAKKNEKLQKFKEKQDKLAAKQTNKEKDDTPAKVNLNLSQNSIEKKLLKLQKEDDKKAAPSKDSKDSIKYTIDTPAGEKKGTTQNLSEFS